MIDTARDVAIQRSTKDQSADTTRQERLRSRVVTRQTAVSVASSHDLDLEKAAAAAAAFPAAIWSLSCLLTLPTKNSESRKDEDSLCMGEMHPLKGRTCLGRTPRFPESSRIGLIPPFPLP